MIRVLLADDEPHVTGRLREEVPWAELDMEVCGIARDGESALKLAKLREPDVVVTDICMPGMDGLALCRALLEQRPQLQIILISGHAEFAYAQEAIRMGVQSYCLKPLDIAELTADLRKARRIISQIRLSDADRLLDALEGGGTQELDSVLHELDLGAGPYYVAASVHLGNLAQRLGANYSCKLGSRRYLYLATQPFSRDALIQCTCFAKKGGIGVVDAALSQKQLAESVGQSITMAYQYFISGRPCICSQIVDNAATEAVFQKLNSILTQKAPLEQYLAALTDSNLNDIFNIRSAFRFYNLICNGDLLQTALDDRERYFYGYEELTEEYATLRDALDDLRISLAGTAPAVYAEPNSSFLSIIRYINENYSTDLSLKKVADSFHMNASYISQLIKSETSLTYTQYVNELRINRAKQLLKTTDLSLAQISEAVGIHDYFYFIKRFKKDTGITPGKYR